MCNIWRAKLLEDKTVESVLGKMSVQEVMNLAVE